MLVITRKREESVIVGEGIRVTVLSIRGGRVRLGFTAPREVNVYRSELLESKGASDDAEEESG
jgi:carbon storage regulator